MYRTIDTISLSAPQFAQCYFQRGRTLDDYYSLGKSLGFSENALITACAEFCAPPRLLTTIVEYPDPRIQPILRRLNECNLPVPREFPAIPENPDVKKFTKLVYVDTAIPLSELISVIKVNGKSLTNYLNLSKIKDVVEIPKEKEPYFVWMQDGALYKNKSPNQAQNEFSQNERGATVREGLFLILYYPEILKDHHIDLPGSWHDRVRVPYLSDWFDVPRLGANGAGSANSVYGSASVGVS